MGTTGPEPYLSSYSPLYVYIYIQIYIYISNNLFQRNPYFFELPSLWPGAATAAPACKAGAATWREAGIGMKKLIHGLGFQGLVLVPKP